MLWIMIVVGALAALAFVAFARWGRDSAREARWYAIGLVVAAVVYVAFAAVGSAGSRWLSIEAGGVVLYGVFAYLGRRVAPAFLAAGWLAHAAWDTLVHPFTGNAFVPGWYPALCLGFDLVVAAAAFHLAWRVRRT